MNETGANSHVRTLHLGKTCAMAASPGPRHRLRVPDAARETKSSPSVSEATDLLQSMVQRSVFDSFFFL